MSTIASRTEHTVKVSECGRFKVSIEALGKMSADPKTAWSSSKIELIDLAKDEVLATSSRDHPDLDIITFFKYGEATYLLISEHWQGGYGVIDCTSGVKKVWQPSAEDDRPFVWHNLVSAETVDDVLILTVRGYYDEESDPITKQFVTENPTELPYSIPPMRKVGI